MLCTARRPARRGCCHEPPLTGGFDLGCWVLCTGRWGWLILMPPREDCLLSGGSDQGQGCPCPVLPKRRLLVESGPQASSGPRPVPLSPTLS